MQKKKYRDITGVILAAGEGTRMKSEIPKALHLLAGKPLLIYLIEKMQCLGLGDIIVVIGHRWQSVKKVIPRGIKTVKQTRLLGSADALRQACRKLPKGGNLLVVYVDTPLIRAETLQMLISRHRASDAEATLLTAQAKNPFGYGRIIRNARGRIVKVAEERDASLRQKRINEINAGVYCFKVESLRPAFKQLRANNVKKEFYLTDIIEIFAKRNSAAVDALKTEDALQTKGINSRQDLAEAHQILNKELLAQLSQSGVTIINPNLTYIEPDVEIGRDTVIYPFTVIENGVKIGRHCQIGPFSRLRKDVFLGEAVAVGNFVEIVRSRVANGTKIKHHSYIGDARIGKNVNIGAGTIIANYDGKKKNTTIIDDGAFIGSNTTLIAPVKVGKRALTGAGSVITKHKNIPPGRIAIGVPARIWKKK